MDDENKLWQKLTAEFLGTAFLVFVGVGSVPALALARGDAPFTGAELGFISLSFALIVVVTVYVFGYISGNHINPAVTLGLAVTGKFPWKLVAPYMIAQVLGAIVGAGLIIGVMGMAGERRSASASPPTAPTTPWLPGVLRRVRRHVPARVRRLRRDLPQGRSRLGRTRDRLRRVRRDHPGRTGHRRLDQPGAHDRPDARAAARRRHRRLGAAARSTSSPSCSPASSRPARSASSPTPRSTARAADEPEPAAVRGILTSKKRDRHEEVHQRPRRTCSPTRSRASRPPTPTCASTPSTGSSTAASRRGPARSR